MLEKGDIHMVTFTSSSTVNNFMEMFEEEGDQLLKWMEKVTVACIGPVTAKTAEQRGLSVRITPSDYTIEALAKAIVDCLCNVEPSRDLSLHDFVCSLIFMPTSLPIKGLLNLVVVYLVWGSTYLFIRVAVREGSGFPPFSMAGSRILCAAAILFPLAWMLGHRLHVSRNELRLLAALRVASVAWRQRLGHLGGTSCRFRLCGTDPRHHTDLGGHPGGDP